MTQEDKELLLKDLCGRLLYNFVYCYCNAPLAKGKPVILTPVVISNLMNATDDLVIKPYLRPMSSMTKKETKELFKEIGFEFTCNTCGIPAHYNYEFAKQIKGIPTITNVEFIEVIDWLNAHYFDYRGLIEKGLALEAPSGMYRK